MRKLILLCILFFTLNTFAEITKQQANKILQNYKDAVLTVRIIQKEWAVMEGKEFTKRETKREITGTVISKDGIIVVSGFATEPSKFFNKLSPDSDFNYQVKNQISGIKIIMPDREEIDGKIVLKDEKLDIYFIKALPEKKIKFTCIDLKNTTDADLLDEVISIDRLGEIGKRENFISISRIGAIMNKPRKYYILSGETLSPGSPVFSSNGKIIGVNFIRSRPASGFSFRTIFSSFLHSKILPVVVPAKDIYEISKQIKEKASK